YTALRRPCSSTAMRSAVTRWRSSGWVTSTSLRRARRASASSCWLKRGACWSSHSSNVCSAAATTDSVSQRVLSRSKVNSSIMSFLGLASGPWVGLVVHLRQMLEVEMSVHLRGADIAVAEQLLHRTQVAGGLQQVTGEGMPQHVRVQMLAQLFDTIAANPQLDCPRRQPSALHADENRLAVPGHRRSHLEPAPQRLPGHASHRDHAGAFALAGNAHLAL